MPAEPALKERKPDDAAAIAELAPAKINLALHVTGQRADGYHLLESIVTFADIGDRLSFSPAREDHFTLSGRFSGVLSADAADNLVIRARDRLRGLLERTGLEAPPVAIHLEKNLPVASGIGGGSADAAAALRGLLRLWQAEGLPARELGALALSLGADVPMCLHGKPAIASGVGEQLSPLPDLPSLFLVLGNPLRGVSTPDVFSRLAERHNPGLPSIGDGDWVRLLPRLRNDLEEPARGLLPEIAEISALIGAQGAVLTRMSGSGATCFGIFRSKDASLRAASQLREARPDWYFEATETIAGS